MTITSIKKLFLSGKGEIREPSIKIGKWPAKRWLRVFNINVQPQIFTLPPDCELAMELTSSAGDKFGVVLKGKLEFLCDKEKLIFEEGDSILLHVYPEDSKGKKYR